MVVTYFPIGVCLALNYPQNSFIGVKISQVWHIFGNDNSRKISGLKYTYSCYVSTSYFPSDRNIHSKKTGCVHKYIYLCLGMKYSELIK